MVVLVPAQGTPSRGPEGRDRVERAAVLPESAAVALGRRIVWGVDRGLPHAPSARLEASDAFIAARGRHADVAASLQEDRRVPSREVDVQLDVVLAVVEDLNAFARLRRHGLTPSRFAEGESSSSPQLDSRCTST